MDEFEFGLMVEQVEELTRITRDQADEIRVLQTALLDIMEFSQETEVAEDYCRRFVLHAKATALKALPNFWHFGIAPDYRFGRKTFYDKT